ncbi:MAG: class I SAM-dependent methyltransferase [Solirubrobacterales bacterium]
MHRFWSSVLKPLVHAVQPQVIVEIGVLRGDLTRRLLEAAPQYGAVVHGVDPAPEIDAEEWSAAYGDAFRLHREISLDALPKLGAVDLLLIDGDHNYHTVFGELTAAERRAGDDGRTPPVIVMHDVDWPYGRRDMYYEPGRIPPEARHPYARKGLRPDSTEVVDVGINAHLDNAVHEGGARNGVRTALEDFLDASPREWTLAHAPGTHGLAVVAPVEAVEGNRPLKALLRKLRSADWLAGRAGEIEEARLWSEVERAATRERASQKVAALRRELEARVAEIAGARDTIAAIQGDLDASRDREAEARRAVQAVQDEHEGARRRVAELEEALTEATRRVEQLEAAQANATQQGERLARELTETRSARESFEEQRVELVGELDRVRAELDAKALEAGRAAREGAEHLQELESARTLTAELEERLAGALAAAEQAGEQQRRLEADLADVREPLEADLLEARTLAEDARRRLEALERQTLDDRLAFEELRGTRSRLQAALGNARADLEVARAERDALTDELERLAAEHGRTRLELDRRAADVQRMAHALRAAQAAAPSVGARRGRPSWAPVAPNPDAISSPRWTRPPSARTPAATVSIRTVPRPRPAWPSSTSTWPPSAGLSAPPPDPIRSHCRARTPRAGCSWASTHRRRRRRRSMSSCACTTRWKTSAGACGR